MWTDYFKLIKLRRGRVITPSHGEIDFSRDNIPIEVCKELFEKGFPYLELTELGKMELYMVENDVTAIRMSKYNNETKKRKQLKNINSAEKCD